MTVPRGGPILRPMSDDKTALTTCYRLKALGNMTRLAIFRLLVRAGDEGLAVGDIQRSLAVPPFDR